LTSYKTANSGIGKVLSVYVEPPNRGEVTHRGDVAYFHLIHPAKFLRGLSIPRSLVHDGQKGQEEDRSAQRTGRAEGK
jgi:hypothetical protein